MAVAALLLATNGDALAQRTCAKTTPEGWEATMAPAKEPGERLVVEGTVTDVDGKPVAGAVVYAYQTDRDGYYSRERDSNEARLCALAKTGADGRYRFHTVRPGSYPGSTIAAHVHYIVSGPGIAKEDFLLEFEGDPFLPERAVERDRERSEGLAETYRGIRPIETAKDGTLVCRRDLRVTRT